MRTTPYNYPFEELIADVSRINRKNRLFRMHGHSPNLLELLQLLTVHLSSKNNVSVNVETLTSDNEVIWKDLLGNIVSLYKIKCDKLDKAAFHFFVGQIAMVVDCIRMLEAEASKPRLVRLFA